VIEVAELLGAGVAKALLGKAAVPDDLPFVTGSIGLLGTKPSWDMMMRLRHAADGRLSFPYSEFLPKEGQARGVQIDIDGACCPALPDGGQPRRRQRETLRALLPLLQRKPTAPGASRSRTSRVVEGAGSARDERRRADQPAARVLGAVAAAARRLHPHLRLRLGRQLVCARPEDPARHDGLAVRRTWRPWVRPCPTPSPPSSPIPDRPVIALVGDGAMQMNGINGLITIAKYWREWSDPRLVVLVLNNGDLNQVTWEQRAMAGRPEVRGLAERARLSLRRVRRAAGPGGIRVDRPEDRSPPAWEQALRADRPTLLEMVTDPNVPPLPPHISSSRPRASPPAARGPGLQLRRHRHRGAGATIRWRPADRRPRRAGDGGALAEMARRCATSATAASRRWPSRRSTSRCGT
jgi:pyruvate dehydrogenase (quinone)